MDPYKEADIIIIFLLLILLLLLLLLIVVVLAETVYSAFTIFRDLFTIFMA